MYLKIENAVYTKELERKTLYGRWQEMEEKIIRPGESKAVVLGSLFEGTQLEINGLKWKAKSLRNIEVKKSSGKIVVCTRRGGQIYEQ